MHWTSDVSLLFQPLRELSRHSTDDAVRSVMTEGSPELETAEFDNWNGGTTYYSLKIHVPVHTFAAVEGDLERVEGEIQKKVDRHLRGETHDFVREVLIQPRTTDAPLVIPPSECQFWTAGFFRLFVSHLHANKDSAHKLKSFLHSYGICAFVAHDDIEPTSDWEEELEKALFSMDAMAAIFAPNFGKSKWTDQEVGVALGRGKLVLPILYGIDPYGLLAKAQGFKGMGKTAAAVSEAVFIALLKNRKTSERLVSCLAEQLLEADAVESAGMKLRLLDRAAVVPSEYVSKIRQMVALRQEFMKDETFLGSANQFLRKHGAEVVRPKLESSAPQDEIPF